jgi:type VI secretion system protein ImpL
VFAVLRIRTLLLLIGLVLIALFIWYGGPFFAFGVYRPLETDVARTVTIALVVGGFLLLRLLRWLRVRQAGAQLATAVVEQFKRAPEPVSAEAAKLRERFEEAVAALTRGRNRHSLYELPWYAFIGAPGSGKTTALVNSGLSFPLEQRSGRAAVRGVGGTRNCDWWFTDEAVFLDTAGRYTTQDSDPSSDNEGWQEFLALLSKFRPRRPLNGIILTISVQDLLTQGDAGREAHVEAARRRLVEFTRQLRVQLPVYVIVTKCDMVPGFAEYFDDLSQEQRAQVWGVTFSYEETLRNEGPERLPEEFDALIERVNSHVLDRLESERGVRRRAQLFEFPQKMAALKDELTAFVADVFSSPRFDQQILLRGVYFTSGTQDGTQIDRLLGAVGRRFGVAADAVSLPAAGRGKAYFIENLLKQVVMAESGLAGVNRRVELRNAAWQLAAYAATLVLLVSAVAVLTASYSANREYLAHVETDVAALPKPPAFAGNAPVPVVLARLDAVAAVADSANRYENDTPWSMRSGLFQGDSLGIAARDAYLRELDGLLLPRFAARLKQRVSESGAQPQDLFLYLKGYLMLGDPRHLDKKHLQLLADREWKMSSTAPAAGTSLANHFQRLLQHSDTLRPVALDAKLVAQAQSTLRSASIPQIMYAQLRLEREDAAGGLQLDRLALGIEKILRRRSGRRLSEPISNLYTPKVFKEVTVQGMPLLARQYAQDSWVWGGDGSLAKWPSFSRQLTDVYERDYIRAWDDLLGDLEIVKFSSIQQYADALGTIVGSAAPSPLRVLLKTMVDNTSIVAAADAPANGSSSIAGSILAGAKGTIEKARGIATGNSVAPGTAITEHFQPIHRAMAGAPAPIDGMFGQVQKIREQLVKIGPQVGGERPLTALTDPTLLGLWHVLKEDSASLPSPIDRLAKEIAEHASGEVSRVATSELDRLYRDTLMAPCRQRMLDRYPFGKGSDLSPAEFGEIFGYGGLFEKFYTDNIDKLAERASGQLVWRPESVNPSPGMLVQFERAERIREMFFKPGGKTPELEFNVRISGLDSAATRFYLDVHGQRFELTPGTESGGPVQWPGKQSFVDAKFEDRVAAPERAIASQSAWAWFHVVDAVSTPDPKAQPNDLLSRLKFHTTHHSAQVTIEAQNPIRNPFARSDWDWRTFRCEP